MALYSSRTGTWSGRRPRVNVPLPETIRDERQWRTEMPGGITRIDYGAPIPRLPSDPQPVHAGGSIKGPPAPAVVPAPVETPANVPSESASARQRDHRAITRLP